MERFLPRILSACILYTLWTCRKAFLTQRRFAPSQSIISERLIFSHRARAAWFYACCFFALLQGLTGSRGPCLLIAGWCLLTLLADRYLCSPHLVHFMIASAALHLPDSEGALVLDAYSAVLYTFAGLQKWNAAFAGGFVADVLSALVHRACGGLRLEKALSAPLQRRLGYAAAATEAGLGVALLVCTRRAYAGVALLHVVILLIYGPLGLASSEGVYGWNLWCLAWAMFGVGRRGEPLLAHLARRPHLALFMLVCSLPPTTSLLCAFGERLSMKMHSQNAQGWRFLVRVAAGRPLARAEGGVFPAELLPFLEPMGGAAETAEPLYRVLNVNLQAHLIATAYLMPTLSARTAGSLARLLEKELGVPVALELRSSAD